jgi:hypothetical protein
MQSEHKGTSWKQRENTSETRRKYQANKDEITRESETRMKTQGKQRENTRGYRED